MLFFCVLALFSCATVTKVAHKLTTSSDSLLHIKRDTSSVINNDSTAHTADKSLVVTEEHIVTDSALPGLKLTGSLVVSGGSSGTLLLSPNGADSVFLNWNRADSTVVATLIQKSSVLHQVIDRTITEHRDVVADIKTARQQETSSKTDTLSHIITKSKDVDTTKTVKTSIFSSPYFIIGIVLILVGLVLMGLFKFGIL